MKNKTKNLLPFFALACSFVSVIAQAQTSISVNQGSVVVRSHHSKNTSDEIEIQNNDPEESLLFEHGAGKGKKSSYVKGDVVKNEVQATSKNQKNVFISVPGVIYEK